MPGDETPGPVARRPGGRGNNAERRAFPQRGELPAALREKSGEAGGECGVVPVFPSEECLPAYPDIFPQGENREKGFFITVGEDLHEGRGAAFPAAPAAGYLPGADRAQGGIPGPASGAPARKDKVTESSGPGAQRSNKHGSSVPHVFRERSHGPAGCGYTQRSGRLWIATR